MKLTFVAILLVLALSIRVNAQETESESYYAIKVAPNFSSYNNCNVGDNYKPVLKSWQVKIDDVEACNIQYGNECIINVKDINKMTIKIIATIGHFDGENKITIGSSDIIGDDKRLKIGKNYLKKSGSDYCNPFHKEGYEFRPVITIDNPIEIDATEVVGEKSIGNQAENFVTTNQNLVFHLNEFYKENDDIELKYSLNGIDSWLPVKSYNGEFTSGGQISISYSDIVGEYSSVNSDYYDNLGRRVWFLIEKRLLDGTKVQSKTVCKNFFQDHAEFKIEESSLYLSSCGNLSLVLNDVDPITIKALKNNELKISAGDLPIYNWSYNGNSISFSYYETTPKTDKEISIRAGVPISEITEEYQENVKFLHPYSQSFKVPEKPEPLRFKQSSTIYPIDEPKYHLESENNPYAILLMEKEDLYHRIPYTVRWTDNNIDKQVQIYKSKNKVSDEESRDEYFKDKDNSYFEGLAKWKMFLEAHFINYFNELIFPQKVNDCVKDNSCDNPWTDVSNYPLILVTRNGNKVKLYRFTMSNIKNKNGQRENNGISYITINNVTDDAWSYIKTRVKKYYNESSISIVIDQIEDSKTTYHTDNPYIYQNYTSSSHYVFTLDDSFYSGLPIEDKGQFVYFDKAEQYVLAKKDNGYYLVNCYSLFSFELKDFSNTAKYVLSYKGDKCAYVCNGMLYCNGKKLGDAESVNTLLSVSGDYVYYKDKNGNIYKKMILNNDDKYHYRELYLRNKDNYDKLLEEYKESSFQNYLLTKHGYRIDDIKANTDYIISINDNDGCPAYETGTENTNISVNVKQPIKPSLSFVPNTNPSSVCSNDGTVTVQINNDNKGNMPLYYMVSQQQVITIDEGPVILPNIGINDIVVMDDFGISYSYPSPFKDSNEFYGITSVVPYDVTCDSQSNGKIVVNFNNNSNIEKTYVLYNNSVRGKSIKTKDNTIRFDGLDVGSNYSVRVEIEDGTGRKCELESESCSIGNIIFSYSIEKNDASVIGGSGTIAIKAENTPQNVVWKCNNETQQSFTPSIEKKAGKYIIEASWDGCSLSKETTIKEPYCNADIDIIYNKDKAEGNRCEIKISNNDACSTTKNEFTPYFVVDGDKGSFFNSLDERSSHVIKYVYGEKEEQQWAVKMEAQNVSSANNHEFSITNPHRCPDDKAQYKATSTNPNVIFIQNGKEINELTGETELGEVSYEVKEIVSTEEKTMSKSSLSIKYSTIQSYKKEITTVERIQASVEDNISFPCNDSEIATIGIKDIKGGKENTQLKYCLRKPEEVGDFLDLNTRDRLATINVTNEGEYVLCLKDAKNGCPQEIIGEITVVRPTPVSIVKHIDHPSCSDGKNGVINIKASGGTNRQDSEGNFIGYIYEICNIEHNYSLNKDIINEDTYQDLANNVNYEEDGKSAGKYNIYVIDGNFCISKHTIELEQYTNPSVKYAQTDQTSCYGYSDGRIKEITVATNGKLNGKDVTPSKLFYSFTPKNNDLYEKIKEKELPWTDGIDNLAAGDYELWVEDNNGCMTDNNKDGSIGMSFTVGQPEHVQLEVKKIADVSGYGASDAVIKVRADGGNNCDKKIYVKKEEAEDESAATDVREDEQSEDEYFIGEAATRGVEYQIAKYPFAEGTYSFYVRDKEKDCPSNVVNDIVVESPDEPLSADIVVRKALCHNQTGSIDITPRGGWGPPYEVTVDGVRYSATPSNPKITVDKLISGEYTVTVKDARKRVVYTTTADVPMPNDDMSFGEGTMFVADRCSGNGGAHIEIVGGSGEYNIMMDGENYTTDKFDIDGLRAGHYKIDVVDGNKCEAVLEFEIADERLSADILSYNKADDGATLEAVVAGGVEPYSYEWRHVDGLLNQRANVSVIDNLEHGIYTLLVTDAGECHAGPIAKEVVTDGDQRLEVVQLQRETGVGSADGYVVLKSGVTDFVSQKIYHIESDGSSTVSDIKVEWVDGLLKVDNLSSGDYVVKCQHSDNMHFSMARFRIEPYEKLDIEGVEVRHVTMPRNRDGRIRISLKGGIAPFAATVAHNTNAAFEPLTIESGDRCFDMERLMAGEYTLTVTDSTRREANMAVQTFVVEEPEYLSLSADMTPAMCYGEPSGKVKLTATGGWGKYMYEYASNGYEKTTEYRRLFPGMQMFSVIDEYGTRKTIEVMVEQPDEVRTQIAQIDSVDCYGSNTGSVTFQVKGGDSNYTMWYSDKNQDELLYSKAEVTHSGLSMGNYRVTFRDGNDCMSVDTITVFIPEPDLLELANDDVVNTTCELDNGKIAIEMKGGSLPYTYSWRENGEEYGGAKTLAMTRSEASGLKQNGLYSIEIVDKNGCKASYEKRIEPSENPRVWGVSTTDVLCYGSSDGVAAVDSAQVKWAYPKADYHLTWPQGQDGVMSVNTLPTGTYIVKITDDNNCSSTTEFTVGTPQPVKNHLVGLRNAMCYGYSDGRIETRTIGGVGDYRYIWSTGEETSYASNLRAGTYKVIVADSHECVDSATFEITEPEELKVNLGEDVIVCPGSSYTFDAGEFASYQWYREDADEVIETERKLTTTDGGNIHILVKNEIGCMARDTVFLGISNEALVANFFVASNVSLNDTVVAIELSNMQPDRIVWEYVNDAFNDVSPSDSTNTYRYLRTEKLGTQYITMWAYKGDCVSSDTKQVDVFENVEVFDDFEIGYDPLIKSVKVAPNPNNGEFFLIITLREVNDVVLRMTDVAGSKVMDRVLSGADYYNEKIDIGKSGIFILTLTVGDEIRSIKILSVK